LFCVAYCVCQFGEKKEAHALAETARKHAIEYGVSPESYIHTMNALLLTLFELLGDDATPAVHNAWEQTKNYVLHHMVPIARQNHRPVVIIIGGGYAGTTAARKLDQSGKFRVIVLERKKYFFHNIGSLRASIDPEWTHAITLPYRNTLKNGVYLHGDVSEIRPAEGGVLMHGRDGLILYKYLVIATGSSYAFPSKIGVTERKDLIANYKISAAIAQKATNILIVGGGPVGVELAGELVDKFGTEKKITIVHRRPHLISHGGDIELAKQAEAILTGLGVRIIFNEELKLDEETAKAHAEQRQHVLSGERTLMTDKGTALTCDLLFVCSGTRVNSASYRDTMKEHVDTEQQHRLKVNSLFQVGNGAYPNVFAVGDCAATGDPLLAISANKHGAHVADNIIAAEAGKPMIPYVPETAISMVLTFGSKRMYYVRSLTPPPMISASPRISLTALRV
jgi:NADH dehydrogenase FAD-containing subunit